MLLLKLNMPLSELLKPCFTYRRCIANSCSTFRSLADDTTGALPYDKDLADQRARYGETLLRKAPDQVYKQEEYENEAAARVEEVRKIRAEEQAKIQAAEVCHLSPNPKRPLTNYIIRMPEELNLKLKLLNLLNDVD